MLQIVLVYCLLEGTAAATGTSACMERRPALDNISSPAMCVIAAQTTAAEFLRGHPNYRLASWRCEAGPRRKDI